MQDRPTDRHRQVPRPVGRGFLVIVAILLISAFTLLMAWALTPEEQAKEDEQRAAWKLIYPELTEADLQPHITYLQSLGSRVAGYPGNEQAALYIAEQFRQMGLADVSHQAEPKRYGPARPYLEEFHVASPIVHSASLTAGGKPVRLYPLWPNVVRTSQLPRGGVDLPLIYAGRGSLAEFNGRTVKGSAVLVEFDTGGDWLNAPRLGASAVIFIAPKQSGTGAERGEGENKFLKIPIDIPRFWISREDAWPLLAQIKSQAKVTAHLECDMAWEERPAWNVIGEIQGSDPKLRNQTVYLEAYYDSMSIVPELAPGADSASGVATMIELARLFKKYPPARTVRFLATGAHFLSLGGIRSYLSQHLNDLTVGEPATRPGKFLGLIPYTDDYHKKQQINYFCALDLSSHSNRVGIFFKGMYYDYSETGVTDLFADFARVCREDAEKVGWDSPEANGGFADGVNPVSGKPWRTYIVGKVALDNEPVTLGGGRGVCFLTTDDSRALVDTPFDRIEGMNLAKLARQGRLLSCIVREILHDPDMPVDLEPRFSRLTLSGGFSLLAGQAVQFEAREGIVPNKVIPGTLVVLRTDNSTLMGVRSDMVDMVDDAGRFTFDGVANINAYHQRKITYLEAYHMDPNTGVIDFAPDMGAEMAGSYPTSFLVSKAHTERTIVIFPCVPIAIYDLVDPQSLTTLRSMTIFDGESDTEPRQAGGAISHPEPWLSHIEDVAIIFAKKGTRFKVIMGVTPTIIRFLLINAATVNDLHPTGLGYLAETSTTIENTPLAVARDMYALDEKRIEKLARFRIVNENVMQLHRQAAQYIKQAEKTLASQDYATMNALARAAWGYESKAYPAIQKTNDDVVKGVIFYLALMLPFSFFMERLLLGAPDLKRQIMGVLGVFAATCLVFSRIHPAFRISSSPWIVPLAFIMLSLSVLVIGIIMMKFEAQLRALQQQMGGVHRADIGRLGVAAAAFSLGISNMRKRRARTIFTCITLVALTFTVLSLTSVVDITRFNVRSSPGHPTYQGIMVRTSNWAPLEDSAYRILDDEFGATRAVAPRAWFFTSRTDEQSYLSISSNKSDRVYSGRGLVGLAPQEARITHLDRALQYGRWFRPEDKNVCILPSAIAKSFNIGPKDVGRAKIYIGGVPFDLTGIIDTSRASSILDLDQERLTPVDFVMLMRSVGTMGGGGGGGGQGFREYVHLSPDDVVFIPYKTALSMGGVVESIAVEFATQQEVQQTLNKLMPRLAFNLYAGQGEEIKRWSSVARTSVGGFQGLVIPIIIVALIVLNTMLGSVYERVKEIHIFSSLGLAPNHIATLFMAEAFVYAVLGAVFGYLVGQSLSIVMSQLGLARGLYLNYSSVSAVASTTVVIATVMLSTIYPARKASEVATPAVERRWQLPEPVGDRLEITLPFAVTGGQAAALNAFMAEWFNGYAEYSVGDFVTEEVCTAREQGTYGLGYCITLRTWLAPFDLGVSQRTELRTVATDMEDVFEIRLTLYRESGEVASWKRVNRRFLNTLRRQFLIWRTLSAKDRDRYLGVSNDAVVGPAPQAAG